MPWTFYNVAMTTDEGGGCLKCRQKWTRGRNGSTVRRDPRSQYGCQSLVLLLPDSHVLYLCNNAAYLHQYTMPYKLDTEQHVQSLL